MIRALVMDFDGIHTDNLVHVDQDGRETVACSHADGMGVHLLRKAGIAMCVISTQKNPVVHARCRKLGLECFAPVDDKLAAMDAWLTREGIERREACYLGNDINDVPCMKACGYAAFPADAHPAVVNGVEGAVFFRAGGGRGFVRAVADEILSGTGFLCGPPKRAT